MKRLRLKKSAGFTLLPVILTMSLIAAIAFLLNRDNGINAEMYADQADLTRARYAAEAGLQAVNYKVQSVGCGGILSFYPSSGVSPVSNNNFGGGSYSAYGNSNWLVPPTTLTSTGTYNGSSVTLTRNNVVTYQSGYKTYTLQPNATAGKDTYINSAFPSRSYGSDTSLRLWTGRYEPLLQFDLSAFPVGSKAAPWFDTLSGTLKPGAELGLYLISNPSATGVNMDILPITRSWIEGTTNNTANGASWNTYDGINAWSSPGVGYDAALVASTPYAATLGWKTWDITGMANSWLSGRYPNNGLWLRPSGTAVGDAQFASSDNSTATQWPKISFNYLLPCGTTGPTNTPTQTTVTLNPVADSHMDNGAVQKNFNYGAASTLIVHGGGRSTRALFRFNTATIPPGSTIISATLRSYVSYISDNKTTRNIQAYTLTESWLEGTGNGVAGASGVTALTRNGTTVWTTTFGTYKPTAVAVAVDASTGTSPPATTFLTGWLTWALTPLVQEWVDGVTVNNGVILIDAAGNGDKVTIESKESTTANKPQLVVTYQ